MTLSGASSVTEGTPYALTLGPVSDPNPTHFVNQYLVHWGDGTTSTYRDSDLQLSNRTVSHTYANGNTTPQISVDLTEQSTFLDTTFGGGTITRNLSGYDEGNAIAVDPTSGKLVGLVVSAINGNVKWRFVRYNSDGTPDTAFGNGNGWVQFNIPSGMNPYGGLAIDSQGRILVAGSMVARYLPDGSLDSSFGSNGVVTVDMSTSDDIAQGIALDAQGRILLTGSTNSSTTGEDIALARLTAAGSVDTSFGGGTGKVVVDFSGNETGLGVAVDPTNGKILVFGSTSSGDRLLRFNADGSLDTTFGNGTGWVAFDNAVNTLFTRHANAAPSLGVAVDFAGRILVGGSIDVGPLSYLAVARYLSDGTRDTAFGSNGVATIAPLVSDAEMVLRPAVDAQGDVILSGISFNSSNGTYDASFARLTLTGAPDTTFGSGTGAVTRDFVGNDSGGAVAVDPTNGNLLVVDQTGNNYSLVRYKPDGTLDTTFGNGTGQVSLSLRTDGGGLAVDSTGRIYVGGSVIQTSASGYDFAVQRFNPNGTPDSTFGNNSIAAVDLGTASDFGSGLCLDAQGRVVEVGSVYNGATNTWNADLVRLTTTGVFDTTFGSGTGIVIGIPFDGHDAEVAVDPTTGNLIVSTSNQFARYTANGTLDTSFGNGTGMVAINAPGAIPSTFGLAVDSSSRVLVGGSTSDHSAFAVLRYNADGSLDSSFGFDGVTRVNFGAAYDHQQGYGLAFDSQGRLILSGAVHSAASNLSSVGLARLNVITPDGPFLGVATQSVTVQDATPTAAIAATTGLPTDASNNPTAPVGTLLAFGGSFSDNPSVNRGLTSTDVVSWSVTLNGQAYSLPASTVTNGPSFSFTPTAVGSYVVTLTVADPDGGTATVQQALDITTMDANSLQNLVNFEANYANPGAYFFGPPNPVALTIQADPTQTNSAVAALKSVVQPQLTDLGTLADLPVNVTVTLNLTSGNYSDLNFSLHPPAMDDGGLGVVAYVTVIVNGVNGSTTVVGHSPALTVTSGNVTVNNVIFTTATDSPTILVAGGSLALRNDTVQSSTGFADAAIAVTGGGTVDLGSTGNPGNNIININGAGQPVQNTTSTPISTAGNTFESGGTVLPSSNFTSSTLSAGTAPVIPGQAVTFTATVAAAPGGSGTPTGTVTYVDATSGVTLGTSPLTNGVATLSTPLSGALGAHVIRANYNGDNTFLSCLATANQSLTQSIYVLNATASGAVSVSGNASINLPGNLIVDSSSKTALTETGNAKITAASIQVVGGVSQTTGTTLTPAATTGVAAVTDPMTGLKGPGTTGMTNYGAVSYTSGTQTLCPGIYTSIKASGTASLTLNPGIYIIEGGGFTVTGKASVNGTGVLIYNTGSNYPNNTGSFGGLTISGSGTVSLSAMTTGTYAGIVIFQPAANTRAISLTGNAANGLTGTVYAPAALLTLGGNASLAGAAVVNQLSLSGNASSTLAVDGSSSGSGTAGQLLAGDLLVYVNDPIGLFTADEVARIQDAVNAVAAEVAPYGVSVTETTDSTVANVTVDTGTTSAAGGYADGVLGCFTSAGEITLIQGWNWYAGSDATAVGSTQYDFETAVIHELGHALGLGHNTTAGSVMNPALATATAERALTKADLGIPDADAGACALHAAGFSNPVSALETGFVGSAEKPGFQGRNRVESDMVFALADTADLPLGSRGLPDASGEPSRIKSAGPVDAVFAGANQSPIFAVRLQGGADDLGFDAQNSDDYVPADFSWQES
jgi:uncharacterized delta-60 repeat protein